MTAIAQARKAMDRPPPNDPSGQPTDPLQYQQKLEAQINVFQHVVDQSNQVMNDKMNQHLYGQPSTGNQFTPNWNVGKNMPGAGANNDPASIR
jgi:hypothetical protein